MEFRFDAMLCSKLGNENSDAVRMKCRCGPQFACVPQGPLCLPSDLN